MNKKVIIIIVLAVVAIVGGLGIYFFVFRKKKATLADWKDFISLNYPNFTVSNNLNALKDTGDDSKQGWFTALYLRKNGQKQPEDRDNYAVDLAMDVWPKWVKYADSKGLDPNGTKGKVL